MHHTHRESNGDGLDTLRKKRASYQNPQGANRRDDEKIDNIRRGFGSKEELKRRKGNEGFEKFYEYPVLQREDTVYRQRKVEMFYKRSVLQGGTIDRERYLVLQREL